jgi:uncharacterized protein (AIM24 family)
MSHDLSANKPLSLAEILKQTGDRPSSSSNIAAFELETDHLLQVNLRGHIWMKVGAMVAYRGGIKFVREGMMSQGLGALLKKAVSGEGASLTKAEGQGQLYLADKAKRIMLLALENESIFVNGNDLLCFEPTVKHEIKMMKSASAIASGGLFNVRLTGPGILAITTHHRPLTLMVDPANPVFTDPQATVAWSGSLTPELQTDFQLKSLIGRGSGETFQMRFQGSGFVIVQPYEEEPMQADS